MPRRLPERAELQFVRTIGTGIVHLLVSEPPRADDAPAVVSIGDGLAAWAAGARPVIVRCGRSTYPVVTARHDVIGEFADEDLCRACYLALHPDDQWRAFEHPQPATA